MYRVDNLELANTKEDEEGGPVPQPDRLQLSAEHVAMNGAYIQDTGDRIILFLGKVLQPFFCEKMFGVSRPADVDENLTDLPELDNEDSERWRAVILSVFININCSVYESSYNILTTSSRILSM